MAGEPVLAIGDIAGCRARLGSGLCHADLLYGIAELNPRIQSAKQRTNARNPSLFELQRHPGAGRFVGSSAIENDVAIAWDFHVTVLDLLWR